MDVNEIEPKSDVWSELDDGFSHIIELCHTHYHDNSWFYPGIFLFVLCGKLSQNNNEDIDSGDEFEEECEKCNTSLPKGICAVCGATI